MLRTFSRVRGTIYGPVRSRRFGSSLGLNLFPGTAKICSFECPYCQLGNAEISFETAEKTDLPGPEEIAKDLAEALTEMASTVRDLNCLTFSGNGEPTAHPRFPEIVNAVREMRNRMVPLARIVVLTNGAHLDRPGMIDALNACDDVVAKIDAGTEETFRGVNQPAKSVTLSGIVSRLRSLHRVVVQTMFVTGEVDNTTEAEIDAWLGHLRSIRPAAIQIYTLDRVPADRSVLPVEPERLREIARRVREECGLEPTLSLPTESKGA
ncbi:MAG: radical SAM protein [Pseudomonadota bacterium]